MKKEKLEAISSLDDLLNLGIIDSSDILLEKKVVNWNTFLEKLTKKYWLNEKNMVLTESEVKDFIGVFKKNWIEKIKEITNEYQFKKVLNSNYFLLKNNNYFYYIADDLSICTNYYDSWELILTNCFVYRKDFYNNYTIYTENLKDSFKWYEKEDPVDVISEIIKKFKISENQFKTFFKTTYKYLDETYNYNSNFLKNIDCNKFINENRDVCFSKNESRDYVLSNIWPNFLNLFTNIDLNSFYVIQKDKKRLIEIIWMKNHEGNKFYYPLKRLENGTYMIVNKEIDANLPIFIKKETENEIKPDINNLNNLFYI